VRNTLLIGNVPLFINFMHIYEPQGAGKASFCQFSTFTNSETGGITVRTGSKHPYKQA